MSKVQTLRAFVNQRLTLAAEEIFELFERTMGEYEEKLCRQHKLLDAVFKPEFHLHREDVQQLLVSREEVPLLHHDWIPLLDQEGPPEQPHIKEEQEELQTSQEGEQLQGLRESDITKITFIPVPVKSEEDEGKPQSSQLHQRQTEQVKTEMNEVDYGGPEPARKSNPDSHLQPATHEVMSHPIKPETDGSCDWKEIREPRTSSNLLQNNGEPVCDMEGNTGRSSVISSECAVSFDHKGQLQKHNGIQAGAEQFSCSVCDKRYHWKSSLTAHMRLHSEGKCFSCSVCKKNFQFKVEVVRHMRSHTGERPFSCSICGMKFGRKDHLKQHIRSHTGEKPFSCSVCDIRFTQRSTLARHLKACTGKGPFTCSVCKVSFCVRSNLSTHLRMHAGEKNI